jgi:hypothetical protein
MHRNRAPGHGRPAALGTANEGQTVVTWLLISVPVMLLAVAIATVPLIVAMVSEENLRKATVSDPAGRPAQVDAPPTAACIDLGGLAAAEHRPALKGEGTR